ncbi:glycogen synthase [bacterium]|nr:glycogen synthase [bacterium]
MKITHITSEFSPFAKAGGLGDVLHGLSKKQVEDGHHVSVILPKYDLIDIKVFDSIEIYIQDLWCYENGNEFHNTVYKATFEGVTIFLIDPDHLDYYFKRGTIYGTEIDSERFLYFSRAAVEFIRKENSSVDVVHLHDWPTAAVAPLVHNLFPEVKKLVGAIIFNIHNIEHQGKIPPKLLTRIGLFGASFLSKDLLMDPACDRTINLMKGAIIYADKVVTVSPSYAKEITTKEFGFGLEGTIKKLHKKLAGVLNGIETDTWNPEIDPNLTENFPVNSTFILDILRKKEANKKALLHSLKMEQSTSGPLVICITRIASQKGPKLILHAIEEVEKRGGSFILLGTICEKPLEKPFLALQEKYQDHKRIHLSFTFDDKLSHKLFAAADALFLPSKFEPCGLTQLISMRYATIPIVRKTGGLKDTVHDKNSAYPTGFVFEEQTEQAVDGVLEEVFSTFQENTPLWQKMMQNGLSRDASWKYPAQKYEKIYESSLHKKQVPQ